MRSFDKPAERGRTSSRSLREWRRRLTGCVTLVSFFPSLLSPGFVWAQEARELERVEVEAVEAPSDESEAQTEAMLDAARDVAGRPADRAEVDPDDLRTDRPERSDETTAPPPPQTQALPSGADKSGVTSQAISVPKGSGTIQGMGESFSAQLSTGIATFSLPFAIPAARGGAQASLGLSYSSAGGLGQAGMGWDVGVPFIARQTDRGLPGYDDQASWHAEQDRFVFNGGQELVPICTVTAGRECDGKLTGEVMPPWSAGYQYFRARVEGSFLRFFWSADHKTWRVQDKSGVTMELGVPLDGSGDTSALERNPDNEKEIYRWGLVRQYDTYGAANPEVGNPAPTNVVVYKYLQDGGMLHLSDIFHTTPAANPTTTDTSKFAHHVRLVYEARTDPTESYRSGWKIESRLRLKRVDVASKPFNGDENDARRQARRYHLRYDPAFHTSLLESVQVEGRCGASEDDAQAELANQQLPETTGCGTLPAMTFRYSHVKPYKVDGSAGAADLAGYEGFDERLIALASSPDRSVDDDLADLFDINSDALPDVLVTAPDALNPNHTVFFNSPKGVVDSFGSAEAMVVKGVPDATTTDIKLSNDNVAPLDLDGDGRIDLLHMPVYKTYSVYTPAQVAGEWQWVGRVVDTASGQDVKIDFGHDAAETRVVDVNFDGLVDVVVSTGTEFQTFYSLGRYRKGDGQFGHAVRTKDAAQISNNAVATCVPWSSTPVRFSDGDIQLAEMNGDGIPDIVRIRRGDIRYWPGRGNGVWGTDRRDDCPAGSFSSNRFVAMGTSPYYSDIQGTTLRVDDVNGDGLDDLVQVRTDEVDVWLNVDGKGWTADRHIIEGTPNSPSYAQRVRLTDINGSGTRDVLWGNAEKYQYMDLTGGIKPGVLIRVENGLGKSTDIEYSTSTEEMLAAEATGVKCDASGEPFDRAWCSKMPLVTHVVKRVTESDNLNVAGQGPRVYTTEYSYRDPVYEGRQREFRGFRRARSVRLGDSNSPTDITETTFLLGECEDETDDDEDDCSVANRDLDNRKEALKGLPILTERFDESGVYLSSALQRYRLRHLYTGLDGRAVRHAFQNATTTFLYDTGPFNPGGGAEEDFDIVELEPSLDNVELSAKTLHFAPRSGNGTARIESEAFVDGFGNQTLAVAKGCPSCGDESIFSATEPDLVPNNETGWLWRTVRSYIYGSVHSEVRGDTTTTYNTKGDPLSTSAVLAGTLPLDRFHAAGGAVAPPPLTASANGTLTLSTRTYDPNLGLLTRETGANERCRDISYDGDYASLPTGETIYTTGCGVGALTTGAAYDRGLGLITLATDMQLQPSRMVYDQFGRLTTLTRPHPTVPGELSEAPSVVVEYFLPSASNGLKFSRIHTKTHDGEDTADDQYLESWAYVDGFGRTLVTLSEAETAGKWIAGSFVEYDAKSAVRRKYLPYFWDGDGDAFPLTTSPGTAYGRQRYDAFGRQVQTFDLDGTVTLKSVYHALSTDLWDAADQTPGPHMSTPASEYKDGHGRTIAVRERIHVGGAIEERDVRTEYLATGEPEVITRVRVGPGDSVTRWMRYDTLGRMVLNVEPNTTKNFNSDKTTNPATMKAWRYAYNDAGDLVGTSDARGCGVNFAYDGAGRLVSEDYSPCEAHHEPYTFQFSEVAYIYDSAADEPFPGLDRPPGFHFFVDTPNDDGGAFFRGRLVAVFDRGSATWNSYDGRGRVIQTAVQAAKPLLSRPADSVVALVAPSETVQSPLYSLDFGSAGTGSISLSGYGVQPHGGSFASGATWPFRTYDVGTSQTDGMFTIAYKNGTPGTEVVTHHFPVDFPLPGTSLYGGGTFDGTALWLTHSLFKNGLAPPISSSSPFTPGTLWDNSTGTAAGGVDIRTADANLISIPVTPNQVTRRSFIASTQVYVPTHAGANYKVLMNPFIGVSGYGLTPYGGTDYREVNFSAVKDAWNLLQVRADIEVSGGSVAGPSDDVGHVTYTHALNGVVGVTTRRELDPTYLKQASGPIQFGPHFFALTRGSNGHAPEVFLDNLSVSEIDGGLDVLGPSVSRYAADWSYKSFAYDAADREVAVSTGVTTEELQGAAVAGLPTWFTAEQAENVVTTQYTWRGTVKSVKGSYQGDPVDGSLIKSITRQADGLITELVYGDAAGTTTSSSYDNRRRLKSVQTYRPPPSAWSSPPANYLPAPAPSGEPTTFQLLLQDEDYEYDVVNNPIEIRDWRSQEEWPDGAKPVTKKIQYDDLYRVTRVGYEYPGGDDDWVSPFAAENAAEPGQQDPRRAKPSPHVEFEKRIQWQSFQYDWLGNTKQTDDDAKGFYDRSLGNITNDVGAKPYQLKSAAQASGPRGGELAALYDDAGNLTRLDVERAGPCLPAGAQCSQRFDYRWDEVGRLVRARRWDVTSASLGLPSDPLPATTAAADLNYVYDAGDQRVLKTAFDAAGEASHTVYLFDSLELRRATFDDVTEEYERSKFTEVGYLSAHGVRLARLHYEEADVPALGAAKLHVFFELGDHLGSTSIVIDKATSELVERSTFQAYGGAESDYRPERWKSFREDYRFTGKEDDVEVGLQYFGKRYLNPLLGRWVSADPLAVHTPGEADVNVYAYVSGQIIKSVDPLGLQSFVSDALDVGIPPPTDEDGKSLVPKGNVIIGEVTVTPMAPEPAQVGAPGAGSDAGEEVLKLLGTQALGAAKGATVTAVGATATLNCPLCVTHALTMGAYDLYENFEDRVEQLEAYGNELLTDPFAVADLTGDLAGGAVVGGAAQKVTPATKLRLEPLKIIVIGEDQAGRVRPTAEALGVEFYSPAPESNVPLGFVKNQQWLNEKLDAGYHVLDVGPSPVRENFPAPTSPYYMMELNEMLKRQYTSYELIAPVPPPPAVSPTGPARP